MPIQVKRATEAERVDRELRGTSIERQDDGILPRGVTSIGITEASAQTTAVWVDEFDSLVQ
jgi:hypothetical protein